MPDHAETARHFLALHVRGTPLLMPNAWDPGSAKLLASLGFGALATTSGGFAATLGRADGAVTRDEVIAHCAALVAATDLPVSADLESGLADDVEGVAQTFTLAIEAGLAGGSIEDWDGSALYDIETATQRVAAAAEVAHSGPVPFVLTARAENHLRGNPDLADTIARLQAYQEAGADVLFAPALSSADEIRQVVEAVERPVSVLALPGVPDVAALAEIGVARVSAGGALAMVGYGAVVEAARELLDAGTYGYFPQAQAGNTAFRVALAD